MISTRVDITRRDNLEEMIIFFATIALLTPVTAILTEYFKFVANRISLGIRSTIYSMLQDKIMKFSLLNSRRFSEGYITNLIQVDAPQVAEFVNRLFLWIDGAARFLIGFFFMVRFAGFKLSVIMLGLFLAVNTIYLFTYSVKTKVLSKLLKAKDERMSYFTNVLENIDFVKINAMENEECLNIYRKREIEIGLLKCNAVLSGLVDFALYFCSYFSTWLLMGYMIFIETSITIDYGFFIGLNSLYDDTQRGFGWMMTTSNYFIQVRVSLNRINAFLNTREINQSFLEDTAAKSDIAIKVENGDFRWKHREGDEIMVMTKALRKEQARDQAKLKKLDAMGARDEPANSLLSDGMASVTATDEEGTDDFFVRGVNLEIKKGERVAVIGRSSSGKSSLLYSVMGEMIPMNINGQTKIVRNGSISFLAQQRWVIGTSIKENICLGKPYNEELMERALMTSKLAFDMKNLSHGIDTVLSDSGDTVSGGQKARIGLARCFYQE
jgi:ATP-binding cassette subfamily C (CFTR/MRP) protein 10